MKDKAPPVKSLGKWAVVYSGKTGKYWLELHPQGTFTYKEGLLEIKRRKEA